MAVRSLLWCHRGHWHISLSSGISNVVQMWKCQQSRINYIWKNKLTRAFLPEDINIVLNMSSFFFFNPSLMNLLKCKSKVMSVSSNMPRPSPSTRGQSRLQCSTYFTVCIPPTEQCWTLDGENEDQHPERTRPQVTWEVHESLSQGALWPPPRVDSGERLLCDRALPDICVW